MQSNIKSNLIFGFSSIKDLKFNECSLIIVVLLTFLSLRFEIIGFESEVVGFEFNGIVVGFPVGD